MRTKHKKLPACSNCRYVFKDANNYCPECGQKNQEPRISLPHLIEEAFESILHFDSKTFITLKHLVFRPGYLSLKFNSGKRASYVSPFRLYIMISFIFFFLLNVFSGGHNGNIEVDKKSQNKIKVGYNVLGISTKDLSGLTITQTDSLMKTKNISLTNFNKWIIYQLHKIANSSAGEFSHSLMKNISYMMFILMPLFGFIIVRFYRKKMNFYIDGISMSIHFHSFIFLVFTVLIVLAKIFSFELFLLLGFIIAPIYIFLMMKRYFNDGILLTLTKTIGINFFYLVSFIVLIIITISISILLV